MLRENKWKFSMRQKYGPEWDASLFAKKPVEDLPKAPEFVDTAVEEKATVYAGMSPNAQREYVYLLFKSNKPCTDNDVARTLGIVPSTVAARRNELIDRGRMVPLLDPEGHKLKKRDSITGELNTLWETK